ncbi:MAG: carbon-nitrogen hydrolase family protein [Pedobacter sp.]|nr:carbon-nitrogen hydrolase family protein [Pedobacter sp.]
MSHALSGKLAVVQMCSGPEPERNWQEAERQLRAAAAAGAALAVLPENFAVFDAMQYRAFAERLPEVLERLGHLARELDLWIVAGTLPAATRPDGRRIEDGRVRTASHVIDSDGEVVARYDKIHLFDVDVDDAQGSYRESATFEPGAVPVCVNTPVGRLGLTVCYDLRFPELFRALLDDGAELVSVPAAFTHVTGEAHWQALLRARAIENQVYVLGAAQGGVHSATRRTWGHSQIIDPWGRVLDEQQADGPGVSVAARDAGAQFELQKRMPVRSHRRIR